MSNFIISNKIIDAAMRYICAFHKDNNPKERFINAQSLRNCNGIPKDMDLDYLVNKLVAMGYILYHVPPGFPTERIDLTKQGLCYFETKRNLRLEFWAKSIAAPIIVSIIISILTNVIYLLLSN